MPPIVIVQGGQYGSEAKGLVAAAICRQRNIDFAVRTGSINAGHTVHFKDNRGEWHICKMQQLPVGWVNPHTQLIIGPGAYVHPPTLAAEVAMVDDLMPGPSVRDRLFIDYRAGLHLERDQDEATDAGRHFLIGATGKGCAEAIIRKIKNRGAEDNQLFEGWWMRKAAQHPATAGRYQIADTVTQLNRAYDEGASILLEGTQGTHLDLHLGPYPYTTSRMTTAANWIAEAGLSPSLRYEVILVLRTHPIRVAGNSGPLPREISWLELGQEINKNRAVYGLPPIVRQRSLDAFGEALETQTGEWPDPLRQHFWASAERRKYAAQLSCLNATALEQVSRTDPEAYRDLLGFFEMTTVTKKLRRIARFDRETALESVWIERPNSVIITFANYDCPWMWGLTAEQIGSEASTDADALAHRYVRILGTPVKALGFGPREDQLLAPNGL